MAGIYIHIPFCKQACYYCNFYFSTSLANKSKVIEAIKKEIELSKDYLAGEKIETIYFGGGTPSLLLKDEITAIIEKIRDHHDLSSLKEFTVEANPDDLSEERVKEFVELKQWGLNRFSIGIQSFFEEDLKYMNRAHNAAEALASIHKIREAGFENITIDLIYGTPTMSDAHWMKNLEMAFELNIPHISSYALTVEPKTALEVKIKKGEMKKVEEEQSARQFSILMEEMKRAGYEQYEISNFAKPGKYSIHNSNYWSGKKYLGIGPSAHSFNGTARRWNIANNIQYVESISKGELPCEEEILTPSQQINERIMTSLRTQWGVRISDFGFEISNIVQGKLIGIDPAHYTLNGDVLTLTNEGKLFADGIAAALFVEEQ